MDKNKILFLALALYCISMALPGVVYTDYSGSHSILGIFILVFGWIAFTDWVFAWFANPLFLLAVFRSRIERPGMLLVVSIIAFCLGLSAYTLRVIPDIDGTEPPVDHLAIGYYVWMTSLGLFVLYGFLRYNSREKNSEIAVQATGVDYPALLERYAQPLIGLIIMLAMLAYVLLK